MATEIEAARLLVYKAAWEKDQGRDFARTAAMAKLYSGELSHRAANWALQIHGGYGFMDEYAISRLYRDQKILEIGEGTNEVQRMVIAGTSGCPVSSATSFSRRRCFFRQFVDEDLGCASYLIGDATAGEAVVVDPPSRSSSTSTAAAGAGVRIVRVLETHTHADHLSGHGRFALEHGVPVSIHPLAGRSTRSSRSRTGSGSRSARVELRVVHTPGHRPEHCAFVVDEALVLTGDSLFVGDAARPDLAIEARDGAADLFRSLARLAALPDRVDRLSRATSPARSAART